MSAKNKSHVDPSVSSSTSPPLQIQPRGLRIPEAALYSGVSPFYIEEAIRQGLLPAIGGVEWLKYAPNEIGLSAYVVLKEDLDKFLDSLKGAAAQRAADRQRSRKTVRVAA
jgi:hypothetical protein